jgi:hypothetical protein
MSTGNRKYDSGSEKRKKKQRLEAAAQSQKGALDRLLEKLQKLILMMVIVMIMMQYKLKLPL